MNEREAIEQLKNHKYWIGSNYGWIDDVCDMSIEALEKQIPKKPLVQWNADRVYNWDVCPVCGRGIEEKYNYCPNCGQALKRE